jgi:nucleoid-associated protein YgaU
LILIVVALVGLQAACSLCYRRADKELEAASVSISDSKQVCGDVYAASAFQNAQRKLDEARAAQDKKECKRAKDLAKEAKALAEQAKTEAVRRGEEARAAAEANLSAARELLSRAEGVLKGMGEDPGAAPFSSRLTSLRELESKVESQLKSSGCDLLLAEEGSKTLLAGAKKLSADIESYSASAGAREQVTIGGPTHSVVRGECLWRIAGYPTIYSDPFLWPLIYSANRDKIKDPDLIFPGQVFAIPRDSSKADKDAAKHKARTRGQWSLHDGK